MTYYSANDFLFNGLLMHQLKHFIPQSQQYFTKNIHSFPKQLFRCPNLIIWQTDIPKMIYQLQRIMLLAALFVMLVPSHVTVLGYKNVVTSPKLPGLGISDNPNTNLSGNPHLPVMGSSQVQVDYLVAGGGDCQTVLEFLFTLLADKMHDTLKLPHHFSTIPPSPPTLKYAFCNFVIIFLFQMASILNILHSNLRTSKSLQVLFFKLSLQIFFNFVTFNWTTGTIKQQVYKSNFTCHYYKQVSSPPPSQKKN